jgi:hypothetical protein
LSVAFIAILSALVPSPAFAEDGAAPPAPTASGLGTSPTDPEKRPVSTTVAIPTVTEIPPWLRGDIALRYSYDRLGGHLSQHVPMQVDDTESQDVEVGQRTLSDHVLNIEGAFSAGPGVAVTIGVPVHIRQSTWFGTSQTMVFDPASGSGTMIDTESVEFNDVDSGSGLEGVWVGLAGTPFSEAFTKRNNRATWKIAGALRTPNKHNFYTAPDGKRGVGNGALGLRFDNAFSTTIGATQPYLSARYQSDGKSTVDVTDADGNVTAAGLELQGSRSAYIRFGAEFLAAKNLEADTNVRVDLHALVNYSSWSLVPSGVYLPSVLEVSDGLASQMSESMEFGGGLGFSFQPIRNFRIGFHGEAAYHMPQRIENPYPVYTAGDTFRATAGLDLSIRIR